MLLSAIGLVEAVLLGLDRQHCGGAAPPGAWSCPYTQHIQTFFFLMKNNHFIEAKPGDAFMDGAPFLDQMTLGQVGKSRRFVGLYEATTLGGAWATTQCQACFIGTKS